jgi:signal transduction histidine kinase
MHYSRLRLFAAFSVVGSVFIGAAVWSQSTLGASLLPHAFCITASAPLLWLHVLSDSLIALAYLLIPLALVGFVRQRRDIPFGWLAWLFGAFIVACGATHVMHVWTLWDPVYWYSGTMKAFTAAVSLATAYVLFRLVPQAVAIPSSDELRRANTMLEREVERRRSVEAELMGAQAELESVLGRTQAQAQQASAVLDHFFEAAPLGLAVLDEQLRFVRINVGLPQATGRPAAEYLGRKFSELPNMPARAVEAVTTVARTGLSQSGLAISGAQADGVERHWLADFFPIALPGGHRLYGCVVQDISYQRRVERQRAEALAAAEEASRAKDDFLARVSHELRSPLQVALSSAEVLRRLPDTPAPARKFIDRLAHAINQQARMINDLLDLSRILSGKFHIVNETNDPALPLIRIVDHWIATAGQREVVLDAAGFQPGQAMVQADPGRLEQVYANLIDNAIRFSPPGGRVVLSTEAREGCWRFSVCDQGAGMSAGEVQRVFEPFVQGGAQPVAGKGLGLGLAIVKSAVEAFGGRVWAESRGRGHGATFFVELPRVAETSAPAPLTDLPDGLRLDGVRLLYVEDEVDVALAMQEGLRQLGAEVEVAHSHAGAIEKMAGQPLDAVVTDLNLGEGPSGMEVAASLHALPQHAHVPVIAVSAFGTPADRAATAQRGMSAHLVKPVDARAVALALQRLVRGTPRGG